MKKKIAALLLAVVTVLSMVGCGKTTFACDLCGNVVTSKKHVVTVDGDKRNYCDDCYQFLKFMGADM